MYLVDDLEPDFEPFKTEDDMQIAVLLIGLLGTFADQILTQATKNNWPKEIVDALVAASAAIGKAHTLAVTKSGLEENRQLPASPLA